MMADIREIAKMEKGKRNNWQQVWSRWDSEGSTEVLLSEKTNIERTKAMFKVWEDQVRSEKEGIEWVKAMFEALEDWKMNETRNIANEIKVTDGEDKGGCD